LKVSPSVGAIASIDFNWSSRRVLLMDRNLCLPHSQ